MQQLQRLTERTWSSWRDHHCYQRASSGHLQQRRV